MKSQRLQFHRYEPQDFEKYFLLMNDLEVTKLITGRVMPRDEAQDHYDKILDDNVYTDTYGWYYATDTIKDEFIGLAKVVSFGMTEAEIGYAIRPEHWRKGYGSEISTFLVDYAKEIDLFDALIGIIDPRNGASKKILERCGFHLCERGKFKGAPAETYRLQL